MQGMLCHANPNDDELDGYIENGRYHEQVAKWLEDYKHIKQWKSDIMDSFYKYDVSSFEELVTNAKTKAIDDFAKLVETWCWKHEQYNQDDLNTLMDIAEQLKAGDK